MWSIVELEVLLHFHYRSDPYPSPSPAADEALRVWMQHGMLALDAPSAGGYRTTPKAAVFIEALKNTPLPVQAWAMPS